MNGTSVPDSPGGAVRARSLILVVLAWVLVHTVACGKTEYADGAVGPTSSVAVCEQTIRPSAQSAPAAGGSFVVEIATGPGCDWTASSDVTWITVTEGAGSGPGSAAYVVQRNAESSARQGRVRIGDLGVSITQAAAVTPPTVDSPPPSPPAPVPPVPDNCDLGVAPSSITVADAGGTSEIVVTTGPRCGWDATTDVPWVRIGPLSGAGPARVRLDVAANNGTTSRTAVVRIGAATVRVTQGARAMPSCESIRLDPETQASHVDGGPFKAALSAPTDCAWTAVSDVWIVVSPSSGSGPSSLSYTVAANDASARTGTIRAGGALLTVMQATR